MNHSLNQLKIQTKWWKSSEKSNERSCSSKLCYKLNIIHISIWHVSTSAM